MKWTRNILPGFVALALLSSIAWSQGNFPRFYPFGTNTNDSACAGCIGETISCTLNAGSATALVTGTPKTICSVLLTPGNWLINAAGGFIPAATTSITTQSVSISLTDNSVPPQDDGNRVDFSSAAQVPGASLGARLSVRPRNLKIAANTNVYLVEFSTFTVSTMSGYGVMEAIRLR